MHIKWLSKRVKRMRIAYLPFAYCTPAIRILHTYHSHIAGCPLACFLFFLAYFLIPFIRCSSFLYFLCGEVNFLHRQVMAKKISFPVMIGKGDFKI